MKQRTFIFATRCTSRRKQGGLNMKMAIYELINNKPIFLAETKYNTAAFKGNYSECLSTLQRAKILPNELDFGNEAHNRYYSRGIWVSPMRSLIDLHHIYLNHSIKI